MDSKGTVPIQTLCRASKRRNRPPCAEHAHAAAPRQCNGSCRRRWHPPGKMNGGEWGWGKTREDEWKMNGDVLDQRLGKTCVLSSPCIQLYYSTLLKELTNFSLGMVPFFKHSANCSSTAAVNPINSSIWRYDSSNTWGGGTTATTQRGRKRRKRSKNEKFRFRD